MACAKYTKLPDSCGNLKLFYPRRKFLIMHYRCHLDKFGQRSGETFCLRCNTFNCCYSDATSNKGSVRGLIFAQLHHWIGTLFALSNIHWTMNKLVKSTTNIHIDHQVLRNKDGMKNSVRLTTTTDPLLQCDCTPLHVPVGTSTEHSIFGADLLLLS